MPGLQVRKLVLDMRVVAQPQRPSQPSIFEAGRSVPRKTVAIVMRSILIQSKYKGDSLLDRLSRVTQVALLLLIMGIGMHKN